jgi:hypothetical protein
VTTQTISKISYLLGVILIAVGLLVPAPLLIDWLRSTNDPALAGQLLVGALAFKACLIVLGMLIMAFGWFKVWTLGSANKKDNVAPQPRHYLVILAVIVLVALGLRLYELNVGPWHDEITTYVNYVRAMHVGEIVSTYISENQHFLFSVLARISLETFGDTVWAVRLPAVLFGVGSIVALYLLGCKVSTPREALLASALLTFSYHHIWFSQNARGYTGLLFWAILSSWLLFKAIEETRPQLWLLYALTIALGIYTQMTMAFVVVGHFVIYLFEMFWRQLKSWPDRAVGFFVGFCFAGFLTIFLHSFALPQVFNNVVEESTVPAWKNPFWTLLELVDGMQVGFAGSFVAFAALIVFGAGVISYLRSYPSMVLLLFVPAIVLTTVVVGVGHHLWPRFFFFTMGFGALIVMRGTVWFAEFGARLIKLPADKRQWLGTAAGCLLVFVSALSVPLVYGPKQDFESAYAYIEENRTADDAVAVVGLAQFTYANFYHTDWTDVETLQGLDELRAGAKRTWIVFTFPPEVEAVYPEIMASIDSEFTIVEEFHGTVRNGAIYVSVSDPASVSAQ